MHSSSSKDKSQRQSKYHIFTAGDLLQQPPSDTVASPVLRALGRKTRGIATPNNDSAITPCGSAQAAQSGGVLKSVCWGRREEKEGKHGDSATVTASELLRTSGKEDEREIATRAKH
jgi:hypothetical protein